MTPENTEKLIAVYPELFSLTDIKESVINHFGFECGDGWYELLRGCLQRIKHVCKRDGLDIKATQIKEKYGQMRIYLTGYTEAIDQIIGDAEFASAQTCEECGKAGYLRAVKRWCFVRCDSCFQNIT